MLRKICRGCGSAFSQPAKPPIVKDRLYDIIHSKLSPAQLKALSWKRPTAIKTKSDSICRPCSLNLNGTVTNIPESPREPAPIENIPESTRTSSRIQRVVVIDALDFPAGIPAIEPNDLVVVNRCDLMCQSQSELPSFKQFCMDEYFSHHNIDPEQVLLTSARKLWNIPQLSGILPRRSEFVGYTNAGKTTLAHTLADGTPVSWPLPFTTANPVEIKLRSSRVILDNPSISMPHVYPQLMGSVRKICSGLSMYKENKYSVPKLDLLSGTTGSIGGMFAFQCPPVWIAGRPRRKPIALSVGIGGLAGTKFMHRFSSLDMVNLVNKGEKKEHRALRMHNNHNLVLDQVYELPPNKTLIIQGVGWVHAYMPTVIPGYKINVYGPKLNYAVRNPWKVE